ncbi:polycystin-1 [Syngnathoides biaculeatus]|uniref:polycystin-1 n=1 Tax=Syngnathoides biaculeatus TaxID=300417 RepID=UPI002ADE79D8|nr:polycystin-1 [Syngnathoides biaculeatus]
MRVMHTLQKQAWIILCVVLMSTAGVCSCPKGSHIHLPSLRCFWVSEKMSTWSQASTTCQQTPGGRVAAAEDLELQNFLHHSFPVKSTEWVWIQASGDGPDKVGFVESTNPAWQVVGSDNHKVCTQMALGMPGNWRKSPCVKHYYFVCENDINETLPYPDSYLVGVVLMTGVYTYVQIDPLPNVPDVEQHAVEMQLFPGLWFSHAGQVTSLELVVQPSSTASLARIQILRPYCKPNNYLVPPGCSSLLNPFSCCSVVPLCNTTGGCSTGQYWCHILEACLPNSDPCSTYTSAAVGRGFALPPRYPAIAPFYHLVAELPLRISPFAELQTFSVLLPKGAIIVYPDDIVAIQHNRNPGAFLHCLTGDAALNSPWRQSYLSLRGTEWGGWWEGGLTFMPQGERWVDGVVCNLRFFYADTPHGGSEHKQMVETTTSSYINALIPSVRSTFGIKLIHPPLDGENQIHIQLNVPTVMVVMVRSGEKAKCSWSAPVLQTGLPFSQICPDVLPNCETYSEHMWFSSVTVVLPSVGVQTLNVTVSDAVRSQSLNVKMCGYDTVLGLSVEPRGHKRMLVDIPQSFTAHVESGSSVTFSWVIDNLEAFAYEGESYSVVFKKPAEYKLKSKQLHLSVDEMNPLGEPEFMIVRQVVAVGAAHLFTLRVKVDIALPATFRWDFGDGSCCVIHTEPAPSETMEGLVERGETQAFVQHSVNFTYSTPGNYKLQVEVSNQFEKVDKSVEMSVRPLLKCLFLNSFPMVAIVNETYLLEASTYPAADNIIYTWDFGDKSKVVQSADQNVEHTFLSAGDYNITLSADNTLSILSTWLMVDVMEKITGLSISSDGPSELGAVTNFRTTVATGTRLIWDYDFGDGSNLGNLTDGSVSQIYKFPGKYTVRVNVSNAVSQAHQFISVVVYRLAVIGVTPTECVMTARSTDFSALLNVNVSTLVFYWLFGEGTPATVVTGQSTVTHIFYRPGLFRVNLTVKSSIGTVSYNGSICVQTVITDMRVQSSKDTAATGEEVCFRVLLSPEVRAGCHFKWFGNSSSQASVTEHTQQCFTFRDEGLKEVSVTATNKVSRKTVIASITVQKPVSNFSLVCDSETLTVNTSASFWVTSYTGSNMSMFWDFGDGCRGEEEENVSHVFTKTGEFTVTATAFNAISHKSVTSKVTVLNPVSEFRLQTMQPYGVVGEETFITAVSSDEWITTYYWTVDGLLPKEKQGTCKFRFVFPKAGIYQVKSIAQNLVSRREALIFIQVYERIEGLHIDIPRLTNMTYLPTHEDVVFVASVTKGSNITYKWLVKQNKMKHQVTADGKHFQFVVETPGQLTIHLSASNKLGDSNSVTSLLAVEYVTGAFIRTWTDIVAVGKFVNISVSVLTGSNLKYFWYVDTDLPFLETDLPFLLHRFTNLGHCFVNVSVQNALSESNDTKIFTVQEEIEEVDFRIGGKMFPFHMSTSATVSFQGFVNKGSDLHWSWQIIDSINNLFWATNHTFTYTFLHEGIYRVSLNVSNAINWQDVTHSVIVQERIEGLTLNITKYTLCSEEEITFIPTIKKGSNVSFVLMFETKDWMHSQNVVDGLFTTSNLPAGRHIVKLTAWNQVSSAQMSTKVQILEDVKNLQLLTPVHHAIEALKEFHFVVDNQHEFPVNYTWIFYLEDSEPLWLTGKEVNFTPRMNGLLSMTVVASNGVCFKMLNKTLTVEWPVKEVQVVCHSKAIYSGHFVLFTAKINGGSNPRYTWKFGNAIKEWSTHLSTVNHTFENVGVYIVMVNVSNSVSHTSTELRIEVVELECSNPQATLIQSQPTIFRSRVSFFEASVDINCSAYKTTYQWEMFRVSNCTNVNMEITGNRVLLNGTRSPFLRLPKHTLTVGQYCLLFTVSLQGTPLRVQRKTRVTVLCSPLVAVIKGGSHRLWSSTHDLVLDGSASQDPDAEQGYEDALQYHWTVMIEVTVCETQQLAVFVECLSYPSHTPIILSGHCEECDDQAQYNWTAHDESGETVDLDKVTGSAGRHSSKLVLRSDAVLPGNMYTFTLNVTVPRSGRWGSASQTVVPNRAPYGGQCELKSESHIHPLGMVVTFNCSGWRDDQNTSSELIYTFQVAPCHPTMCPVLTLYKGTRSTFGSVVPVGSPVKGQNKSFITVTLHIEDNLGASVIALNRTLSVQTHVNASEWLRSKSRTEMWALIQHGNPQEIIPYSIALTSQLNQIESGQGAREVTMKSEIRENVTKVLVSLPISSLMDVDQISSALALSTALPPELMCVNCQEKVLEAVGKMIHVMEEHKSPGGGGVAAFDTGRNILSIIGSSLAAASLSTIAFSSRQNYSSSMQAASVITLSAMSQAGALMRSLMHSSVSGEVPLSFVTPYISTAGFFGDPSDLLCSKQSNPSQLSTPSCPFLIPTSLTTHLKSQCSELVQVVLTLDESHAFLAAADPPISTTLVAMEITTPQGEPVPVRDLEPDQAIRITLHSKHPVENSSMDGRVEGAAYGACPTVQLTPEKPLNFTIKNVWGLDEHTGLYISFNFTLLPGVNTETLGHVKIEITCGSHDSFKKEWPINLTTPNTFREETVFLSPLSVCQYYSVKERTWSSEGLKPLEGTTLQAVQCLTHHLTMFGASLFLHPGAVVLLPPAGGPILNVMVGIVCCILVLIHLLVGLIAHKMDHLDSLRQSQVSLCGRAGLYHYRVLIKTGWRHGAGTTAHVGISLYGVNKSGSRHLQREGAFQRGSLDQFHLETDDNLGEVWKIRIWHDNTGLDPSWYVQHVVVWDPKTDHMFFFLVDDWLSVDNPKNGTVEKEILASGPVELSQFQRILSSQLLFGMVDRHLWLSLWERPIHSVFTRAQRVTCCALMLHLYLALGALWFGAVGSQGHSGPVSAKLLVNMETVAVGVVVAVLLFPLQCLICFLFRNVHSQVILDTSVPPSPVCYSVEMDVYLGQTEQSGPSFLSLSGPSSPLRDSPSSLLESKAIDSSILDFWAASCLVPQIDDTSQDDIGASWESCGSLLKESEVPDPSEASLCLCTTRQLTRKKACMQLNLTPRSSSDLNAALLHPPQKETKDYHSSSAQDHDILTPLQAHNHNMTNFLTLSEENLLMSIEEATEDSLHFTRNNSDSGRDSPTTTSSFSNTNRTLGSSWSEHTEDEYLHDEPESLKFDPHSSSSRFETKLYRCPSVLSIDSVASTFLPSPYPDSTRCSSTTRIGIIRRCRSWLFPPWVLYMIYPLVAVLIGACLALVGIYGSLFSRTVVLMWLISALSAFFTSALLLEPLKVCIEALIYTIIWRPVDPEVEDQLAQETTVVRVFGKPGGKVQPPCGYGLLQAKEEARKVRALRSLMRQCAFQLVFLLLVLMVNYQDSVERRQGQLLHSAVQHQLHTTPLGVPNLTAIRNCIDAEQWMNSTFVSYLYENPSLRLVGSPRLQYAHTMGLAHVTLGNSSMATQQVLDDLHMGAFCIKEVKTLSLDFTQYHRESGLFLCLSIQLDWMQRVTSSLSIHPVLIPSSPEGFDLHLVLMFFLLSSALLILFGEVWSMANEHCQYLCQGKHWLQLILAALSLATSVLHLCFLSKATSCVSQSVKICLLGVPAAGNIKICAEVGCDHQSPEQSLERVVGLEFPLTATASVHCSPREYVEGFLSMHQVVVSLMSILRGRLGLQRLCRVHPVFGPLYGLMLIGACFWFVAKLLGAVLIRAYRAEKAHIYQPMTKMQDYEMLAFFIKRVKLWLGLTKVKEFRHRVKFEGIEVPSSRVSQESRLSTFFSSLPSSHSPSSSPSFSSPRPVSSSLSVLSEDSSFSEHGFDVQPFLDQLLPCVNALLSQFDRVTQITEDVHNLEIEFRNTLCRRKKSKISNKEKCEDRLKRIANAKDQECDGRNKGEVRRRRTGLLYANSQKSISSIFPFTPSTIQPLVAPVHLFPRTRSSHSESESLHLQYHMLSDTTQAEKQATGIHSLHPVNSPAVITFPKRRAWHSGSSHSADAAQRMWLKQGGVAHRGSFALPFIQPNNEEGVNRRISNGAPKKRKAWISEGPS